mmetsp:Transcript_64437/g.119859  ORF Transcript_64437/g.119859 Transcript_64437/m.119859 type:complete len:207 (-) Transcript_64437:409-1029(-)
MGWATFPLPRGCGVPRFLSFEMKRNTALCADTTRKLCTVHKEYCSMAATPNTPDSTALWVSAVVPASFMASSMLARSPFTSSILKRIGVPGTAAVACSCCLTCSTSDLLPILPRTLTFSSMISIALSTKSSELWKLVTRSLWTQPSNSEKACKLACQKPAFPQRAARSISSSIRFSSYLSFLATNSRSPFNAEFHLKIRLACWRAR